MRIRTRSTTRPSALGAGFLCFLLAGMVAAGAAAQTADYSLTPLGQIPGAYSTIPTGMNDAGDVVGWAQFIPGNPSLVAWLWTADAGFTVLPRPPTMDRYRAMDINNSGVIAGDGGFDSGEAWRFSSGSYELLGRLGNPVSVAAGINENGDIAGTARSTRFAIPHEAFIAIPGEPTTSILTGGQAGYLNNVGQVVGYFSAWRYTPGVGVEILPPLGSRTVTYAYGVNDGGNVVGAAGFPTASELVPFIFTDSLGMREIGNFGAQAGATSINDASEVVGNYDPSSGPRPWIWSPGKGLRFLRDLIDLAESRPMGAHKDQ